MSGTSGTIGTKQINILFDTNNNVKIVNTIYADLYFIAVERVSSKLKTCEIIIVNSKNEPVIVTISQTALHPILNKVQCPIINIGQDPENWPKLSTIAQKNNWQKEDWIHVFSEADTEEDEEKDEEWLPTGLEESSDSDSE
tara:strand:+ start:589 stop:1011 length:423 start_codon:yes stop_codon:yes gene_type:complete